MNCSYHPNAESRELCRTCNKPLCLECSHQIKGQVYCQDCLVRGAEWAAAAKDLRIPTDSPKRAALLSLIPGMGAVYNNEYIKAATYFAVFAGLIILGGHVHGIFGMGAFAFLVFTMFDSYRIAEEQTRAQLSTGKPLQPPKNSSNMAWGVFLIILGVLFLLQELIPYQFLHLLWPLVFICLGGYLVFRALKDKKPKGSAEGILEENN